MVTLYNSYCNIMYNWQVFRCWSWSLKKLGAKVIELKVEWITNIMVDMSKYFSIIAIILLIWAKLWKTKTIINLSRSLHHHHFNLLVDIKRDIKYKLTLHAFNLAHRSLLVELGGYVIKSQKLINYLLW